MGNEAEIFIIPILGDVWHFRMERNVFVNLKAEGNVICFRREGNVL